MRSEGIIYKVSVVIAPAYGVIRRVAKYLEVLPPATLVGLAGKTVFETSGYQPIDAAA